MGQFAQEFNFNTSNVIVNRWQSYRCYAPTTISIHLMLLLIKRGICKKFPRLYISIHLMLLLIMEQLKNYVGKVEFQYI